MIPLYLGSPSLLWDAPPHVSGEQCHYSAWTRELPLWRPHLAVCSKCSTWKLIGTFVPCFSATSNQKWDAWRSIRVAHCHHQVRRGRNFCPPPNEGPDVPIIGKLSHLDSLASICGPRGGPRKVVTLESLLKQFSPGNDFKRVFILFALGILLAPPQSPFAVRHLWSW